MSAARTKNGPRGNHDDDASAEAVLPWQRPMWGPRGLPGGVKGQPTVEPRPAAQHPSLGVELAFPCPQAPEKTPAGPPAVWAAHGPISSRDAAAARRRVLFYQAPYGRPRPRRHRRDSAASPGAASGSASTYMRPARPGPRPLARLSHAVAPRQATSSARGRHDRQDTEVLFFFYDKT